MWMPNVGPEPYDDFQSWLLDPLTSMDVAQNPVNCCHTSKFKTPGHPARLRSRNSDSELGAGILSSSRSQLVYNFLTESMTQAASTSDALLAV